MTPGKKKCKMLREIRKRIADENDIPFVTEDCKYKGDCKGTCPKCESELRYLEEQLEKRRSVGKRVTVAAVALGLAAGLSGCGKPSGFVLEGDVPYSQEKELSGAITVEPGTTAEAGDSCEAAAAPETEACDPDREDAPQTDDIPVESTRNDG